MLVTVISDCLGIATYTSGNNGDLLEADCAVFELWGVIIVHEMSA